VSEIFADSFYWIALANPADVWHQTATHFSQNNSVTLLVTTDEVLIEFLNYFSASGERKRSVVANMFEETMSHSRVLVTPQTRESLLRGFDLYKARADKGYSLTDCISMTMMRERNIKEILTHDRHFVQEGFSALF
jgi:predicted nucleic acid-binding protein